MICQKPTLKKLVIFFITLPIIFVASAVGVESGYSASHLSSGQRIAALTGYELTAFYVDGFGFNIIPGSRITIRNNRLAFGDGDMLINAGYADHLIYGEILYAGECAIIKDGKIIKLNNIKNYIIAFTTYKFVYLVLALFVVILILFGMFVGIFIAIKHNRVGKKNHKRPLRTKICPHCKKIISEQASVCLYCGNEAIKWNCPKCEKPNPNDTFSCLHCGYNLK